jgi:hypothetical protein
VAQREDGTRMFNYSELLGSTSSAVWATFITPTTNMAAGDTARRIGYGFAFDVGYDVLREFWPEITRSFKPPFRSDPEP